MGRPKRRATARFTLSLFKIVTYSSDAVVPCDKRLSAENELSALRALESVPKRSLSCGARITVTPSYAGGRISARATPNIRKARTVHSTNRRRRLKVW